MTTIEKKNDSSVLKGKEKVVTQGKKGTVERTYEVVKENGKVVTKAIQSEKVVSKPTTQVVAVGTKVVTAAVSRNNAPASGKEFYVTATAYTPNCKGCTGVTATGVNIKENSNMKLIAVDLFYDGVSFKLLATEKVPSVYNHGAGCTFAASVCANLANGLSVEASVLEAKQFVSAAIANGWALNEFVGPVMHGAKSRFGAPSVEIIELENESLSI